MYKKLGKTLCSLSLIAALTLSSAGNIGSDISFVEAAKKKTNSKITMTCKKKTIVVGKTYRLTAKKVANGKRCKKVTWKSSNKKVATVNKNGVVTGKKKGVVTITAILKENKKIKATCKIIVKEDKVINNNTKSTTEESTIENTRIESTVEVKTEQPYFDMTTEQTTQVTTEDNSTQTTTEEEAKDIVKAQITGNLISATDTLIIKYEIMGNSRNTYYYNMYPGKLERYENGEWVELEQKELAFIEIVGEVSPGNVYEWKMIPDEYYKNVTAGHYRYTKNLMGVQNLPVVVEFDIEK